MNSDSAKTIRVFSARACAAPLEEAAALFEADTGISVDISVCTRHCATQQAEQATPESGTHDFLVEIAEYGIHDLAVSGAEYLLDDGEVRGIVQAGQRRVIAYRKSALIVPADNPAKIQSLADLARPGVRIGVSVIDCLKGLWEDVTGKAGLTADVGRNITFYASGCVAIVEAVCEGLVDAAFGWTSFYHLGEARLAVIELPPAQTIYRATGIGMLSFTKQPEIARQFMDFLTTPQAGACYEKYRWVLGSTLKSRSVRESTP